jgi:uncharacterized phage protein (TIGR01671 family)
MENRIIKFRSWNKKFNYWDIIESIDGDFNEIFKMDCFIFQQYVGLSDISGTDIFEGDILKYSGSFMRGMNFAVEYSGDRAAWCVVSGNCFMLFEEFMDFCDSDKIDFRNAFKIIGNIFENPDMFK